jgi:hypothetical protein
MVGGKRHIIGSKMVSVVCGGESSYEGVLAGVACDAAEVENTEGR